MSAEELSRASQDVLAERRRQVESEGWSPEHDDEHDDFELSMAALCYLQAVEERCAGTTDGTIARDPPDIWPWEDHFWKPRGNRRDLVRAGALILAEIERLDRAASSDFIVIAGEKYRRFIPHPGPVTDGTVRCIFCGQIDEPPWHDDDFCTGIHQAPSDAP